MNLRPLLLGACLSLLASSAQADVLHLRNGRKLEGKVLKTTSRHYLVRMPSGKVRIPKSIVKRLEEKLAPRQAYAQKAKATDMKDPVQVEALATWAAEHGLSEEARQLTALARGVRLELRMLRAKRLDKAEGYLQLYHWARRNQVSYEVQLHVLGKAKARDRKLAGLKLAYRLLERDLARVEARLARLERKRNQPQYLMPSSARRSAAKAKKERSLKERTTLAIAARQQELTLSKIRALRKATGVRAGKVTPSYVDPRSKRTGR